MADSISNNPSAAVRPRAAQRRGASRETRHDLRILMMALMTGLPAVIIAEWLLWTGNFTTKVQWTLTLLMFGCWLSFAFALRERVVRPLQTISNLLAALHEEDFSVKARGASRDDALGELLLEVNSLGDTLREQKMDALEAVSMLRAVMEEIEVAVFAFDGEQRLRLVNRAGEKLLGSSAEALLGKKAADIGLAECFDRPDEAVESAREFTQVRQLRFPGGAGRYGLRRGIFYSHGRPHQLLVISDLSQALRDEERIAWQRLVRVLGHELNNSLTPIKSIAGSLESLLHRAPRPADWESDVERGLEVIATRAESLNRFMGSYARLAKLPAPNLQRIEFAPLMRRVCNLERRLAVKVVAGPNIRINADGDQLEQLFINLLRNAVDASLETGGGVQVSWRREAGRLLVSIEDEGPGLASSANLFVPFFTTKPQGSGIGLAISRQIAEAHGGTLSLENRITGQGCEARFSLPL
jgi:nitrogen fixation/metabolism regulation signal transduction histidine kinase